MFFVDSIDIYVSSGKGGNGCVSFNRSAGGSLGRADGGNGGKGGDVYFFGDRNIKTFNNLKFNLNYKSEDGFNGEPNLRTGKNGEDLYISVPLGTVIYDKERNVFIGEVLKDHDDFLVLKGGRPGYGNFFLKSCDKNIFCKLILGGQAKLAKFHLELKILADVGLLGFPNVGKSLFINRVSNVSSKVGDYSFTTLYPVLGTLKFFNFNKILIADIPGIIEGSCLGVGLGFNFLKHLLKTKLLLHFIDIKNISCKRSLLKELVVLNNELKNYNLDLLNIKKWLIFNKSDLVNDFYFIDKKYLIKFNYYNLFFISSKNDVGLKKLCFNLSEFFSDSL